MWSSPTGSKDERNDLHAVEAAVAAAAGDDLPPVGPLRQLGLEDLVIRARLDVTATGLVDVQWDAPDDDIFVRGGPLGEDATVAAAAASVVLAAASPFLTANDAYPWSMRSASPSGACWRPRSSQRVPTSRMRNLASQAERATATFARHRGCRADVPQGISQR